MAIIHKPVKWIKSNRIFSRKTDENQVNPGWPVEITSEYDQKMT